MAFHSIQFFAFFAVVYLLLLLLKHKGQNRMLLVASYFFYGCWDWRFLSLIFISTLTDYLCGIQIDKHNGRREKWIYLTASLCINLGILAFFKYCNFFVSNLLALLSVLGLHPDVRALNIILPVGISFYTFQSLSYTVDVYRKQVKPCTDFLDYALYVSLFPQLVAGPIERSRNLLPQIQKERTLRWPLISEGALLIYWGLFKKLFIADNLGTIVDEIFEGDGSGSGAMVLLGCYAFSFQVYCDFSAYSDIARGVAKLMGFELMVNFRRPYFASNIQEFWSRWHISLTTWIRDYLYYPLALTRIRKKHIDVRLLTIITFLIMGLWHGAAWNFVLWGGYHGILLALFVMIMPRMRRVFGSPKGLSGALWNVCGVIFTFHLCAVGSLLFRGQSLDQISHMSYSLVTNFEITSYALSAFGKYLLLILPVLLVEALEARFKEVTFVFRYPKVVRYAFYSVLFYLMAVYGSATESFIYFQF